jgi:hypothetical protein
MRLNKNKTRTQRRAQAMPEDEHKKPNSDQPKRCNRQANVQQLISPQEISRRGLSAIFESYLQNPTTRWIRTAKLPRRRFTAKVIIAPQ